MCMHGNEVTASYVNEWNIITLDMCACLLQLHEILNDDNDTEKLLAFFVKCVESCINHQ